MLSFPSVPRTVSVLAAVLETRFRSWKPAKSMFAAPVLADFVRWEAAAGHSALVESGLWEPYEPLIRLFERGGELFTHHGFIHVEHSASFFPRELKEYGGRAPLLDMRDWALDRLDRAGGPDAA